MRLGRGSAHNPCYGPSSGLESGHTQVHEGHGGRIWPPDMLHKVSVFHVRDEPEFLIMRAKSASSPIGDEEPDFEEKKTRRGRSRRDDDPAPQSRNATVRATSGCLPL